jgi:glucosylceramidase
MGPRPSETAGTMDIAHVSTTEHRPWRVSRIRPRAGGPVNLELSGARFQTVKGFGGCFNELGHVALARLPAADQARALEALFGDDGCRFSFCRLPIGASDYALEWYSLDETPDDYAMKHFTVARDEQYLIPYIRRALKVRPDIRFFASPWSPPTWMKTVRTFNHGTLRWEKRVLAAYALYFQRFVEAYHERGINVCQVHVQNEPMSDQKFPSCVWTGDQMREFIADYLGPRFARANVPAEVWLGTINGPEADHRWPWSRFDQFANLVLSDPKAARYTRGVAYQWAGKFAVQQTHEAYPDVPLIQSENECGDGANSWRYALYVWELIQHYFTNHVVAYVYWNMILPAGGRSTWGWPQNSMMTVDPQRRTLAFTHEYYVMKHLARFVQGGAVRLGLRGPWTSNALCFENPDGSTVLAMVNPFSDVRRLSVHLAAASFEADLDPSSFHTFVVSPVQIQPRRHKGAAGPAAGL